MGNKWLTAQVKAHRPVIAGFVQFQTRKTCVFTRQIHAD